MEENRTSIWYRDVNLPEYPAWSGEGKTEVAVIGGGLTGILTAFFLKEAGKKVILLEADRITDGQTGRTTAKITSQHGLFYGKYRERLGTERLRQYAAANEQAIRRYRTLVKERKIDCDWQDCNAYLYAGGTKDGRQILEQEWKGAAAAGIEAKLCSGQDLPELVRLVQDREAGAVCFPGQAAFHPLKFLQALLPGLEIYERSPVEEVEGHRVLLAEGSDGRRGSLEAEQIVFACHYPFPYRPGYYFLRLHQERSYVLAVKSRYRQQIQDLFYPAGQNGLSVRPWGEYLLLGGAGHRTGSTSCNPYEKLREMAFGFDPDYREIGRWSAQDTFSLDELPYIGVYSPSRPDWYVATAFKKWGMTHAMIAAELLTAQITGQPAAQNPFEPSRFLLSASASALAEESLQVAAGLAKSVVDPPRCTHLGCSLVWNDAEGTWDCPCHGSRFQGRNPADGNLPAPGQVLDGPARRPLRGNVQPTDTAG